LILAFSLFIDSLSSEERRGIGRMTERERENRERENREREKERNMWCILISSIYLIQNHNIVYFKRMREKERET
jgi:hypothetical protein